MSDHTAEPWVVDRQSGLIYAFGLEVCDPRSRNYGDHRVVEANARRIVACINACKGISTDELEALKPGDLLGFLP